MIQKTEIKGIITPIITPMLADESINFEELRRQTDRLITAGCHAIFCFGTNGEGYALSGMEKKEVLECVIDQPETAAVPADVVLCAVVGAAGLRPLLSALDAGNRIALANKESLVMAGRLVMERARDRGVEVLPVDSEHNAVFQCLHGHRLSDVRCVHLTASGGPFYGRSRESLEGVAPEQAASPRVKQSRRV